MTDQTEGDVIAPEAPQDEEVNGLNDDGSAPETQGGTDPEPEPEADEPPAAKGRGRRKADPALGNDGVPREFTVGAKEMKAALAAIDEVIESRNTIPILSNLRLVAEHGRAELIGTDLDLQCVRHLMVEQDMTAPAFATTVSEKLLKAIVAKVPADATIRFTLEPGKVVAVAGRAKFTMPTLPVDDFPTLDAGDADHVFELSAFDLAAMIDGVRTAMSTEETRYYLNGIYLLAATRYGPTGDGDGTLMVLRAVATDGHRLAQFEVALPDGAGALNGVILPRKAVGVIAKLLDGYEGPVEIAIGATKARFDLGDTVLTTKLVDGTYPDYTRVIPRGNDKLMQVAPKVLAEAVARVGVMSAGKDRAVKLSLERDMATLTCTAAELGTATEECPCDYDGEPLTIGFNGGYLADLLGRVQGDTVSIEMSDAAGPTLLRDANPEARGLFVLMPMRV